MHRFLVYDLLYQDKVVFVTLKTQLQDSTTNTPPLQPSLLPLLFPWYSIWGWVFQLEEHLIPKLLGNEIWMTGSPNEADKFQPLDKKSKKIKKKKTKMR